MLAVIVAFVALLLISLAFTAHTVQKYKQGVVFRLGRFVGERSPGLVMVPIQSQGLITRDNLSVDVSAVSYYESSRPRSRLSESRTSKSGSTRSPRRHCDRSSVSTL